MSPDETDRVSVFTTVDVMSGAIEAKRELRRTMRAMRRTLPDQAERSELLWGYVKLLPEVIDATNLLVFDSVPGEPVTAPFIAWCRDLGKTVALPEDEPLVDPQLFDVVIVPGTAFTPRGNRLGQGGGWYDRFLPKIRDCCITIGVGFAPQLVESLPLEPHDVHLDLVVTDGGIAQSWV